MKHQIYSSIGFLIKAFFHVSGLKEKSLCQTAEQVYLTNRQWFGVVCTVFDSDIHHHSGQNVVDHEAQPTGIVDFIFYHDIDVK